MGVQVLQEHIESMMKTIAELEERLTRVEGERDEAREALKRYGPPYQGEHPIILLQSACRVLKTGNARLHTRLARAKGLLERYMDAEIFASDLEAIIEHGAKADKLAPGTIPVRIPRELMDACAAFLAEGEGENP